MKRNDLAEIKKLKTEQLQEKTAKIKEEISTLVLDKSMNKLSNIKQIKNKRKDLAQILTILRQKQLLQEGEVKE